MKKVGCGMVVGLLIVNGIFTESRYFVYQMEAAWYYQVVAVLLHFLTAFLIMRSIRWLLSRFFVGAPPRFLLYAMNFAVLTLYNVILNYVFSFLYLNFVSAAYMAFMFVVLYWFAGVERRRVQGAYRGKGNHIGSSLERKKGVGYWIN